MPMHVTCADCGPVAVPAADVVVLCHSGQPLQAAAMTCPGCAMRIVEPLDPLRLLDLLGRGAPLVLVRSPVPSPRPPLESLPATGIDVAAATADLAVLDEPGWVQQMSRSR